LGESVDGGLKRRDPDSIERELEAGAECGGLEIIKEELEEDGFDGGGKFSEFEGDGFRAGLVARLSGVSVAGFVLGGDGGAD